MKTPVNLGQRIEKLVTGRAVANLPAARFVKYVGTEVVGPYGGSAPIGINPDLMTFAESRHVDLPGAGGAGGRVAGVNYYEILLGDAASVVTEAEFVGVEIVTADLASYTAVDLPVATDANGRAVLAAAGDVIVGYTRSVPRAGYGYEDANAPGGDGQGVIGLYPFDGQESAAPTYYLLVELNRAGNVVPA